MVPWRTIGPALEDYWLNGPFQPRAECFHSLALPRTPKGREDSAMVEQLQHQVALVEAMKAVAGRSWPPLAVT